MDIIDLEPLWGVWILPHKESRDDFLEMCFVIAPDAISAIDIAFAYQEKYPRDDDFWIHKEKGDWFVVKVERLNRDISCAKSLLRGVVA